MLDARCSSRLTVPSTTARLAEGKRVEIPVYDFVTNARCAETQSIYGVDVLILEGILTFHDERLRNMLDMVGGSDSFS